MLKNITIKDFAIIDNINLDLHDGLHVLTGETGAGKSIIIEAISMALGGRADTSYVRTGKPKAVIEITIDSIRPEVKEMLLENGLEDDDNLFIAREISSEGKSICRVNGSLVSLTYLSNLCKKIADIHGQYDHQSLLDVSSHLRFVDSYHSSSIEPVKDEVSRLYKEYSNLKGKIKSISKSRAENQRKHDFMRFEISEINQARLVPGEDDALDEQLLLLKNSETLYSTLSEVYELLYGSSSSLDGLSKSTILLNQIKNFSSEYEALAEIVSDCFYKLEDVQAELRRVRDSIVFSEEAINESQERIDLIDRLKKKYGATIEKILEYREEINKKLDEIDNWDTTLENLTGELQSCESQLISYCDELTSLRHKAAKEMEKDMARELKDLNFKDSSLIVSIRPLPDQNGSKYTDQGCDQVEFLMVTNKGEKPKPLNKIASGGEISRIMLAFKAILGNFDNIPTLIFDEIDSGISGVTASIVGNKMREISQSHQVICITHLAQIAAFSDYHYLISKEESEGKTATRVNILNEKDKVYEIARLLGGLHITETTLRNAQELIDESLQ